MFLVVEQEEVINNLTTEMIDTQQEQITKLKQQQ